MRRNRRLLLMDRTIPFLAAFVGLVALAGAVLVQVTTDARNTRLAEAVAALRQSVDDIAGQAETAPADAAGPELVEAVLALQQRIERLEADQQERAATAITPLALPGAAEGPVEDCIPQGTRFMAMVGDEMAICQTSITVRVSAVTDDNVLVENVGVISVTAARPIAGTNCTLSVLTADGEGFAEFRVSCL